MSFYESWYYQYYGIKIETNLKFADLKKFHLSTIKPLWAVWKLLSNYFLINNWFANFLSGNSILFLRVKIKQLFKINFLHTSYTIYINHQNPKYKNFLLQTLKKLGRSQFDFQWFLSSLSVFVNRYLKITAIFRLEKIPCSGQIIFISVFALTHITYN